MCECVFFPFHPSIPSIGTIQATTSCTFFKSHKSRQRKQMHCYAWLPSRGRCNCNCITCVTRFLMGSFEEITNCYMHDRLAFLIHPVEYTRRCTVTKCVTINGTTLQPHNLLVYYKYQVLATWVYLLSAPLAMQLAISTSGQVASLTFSYFYYYFFFHPPNVYTKFRTVK